jgi:hypothetical protein
MSNQSIAPKQKKPFFKRTWVIITGGIVALFVIIGACGDGGKAAPKAESQPSSPAKAPAPVEISKAKPVATTAAKPSPKAVVKPAPPKSKEQKVNDAVGDDAKNARIQGKVKSDGTIYIDFDIQDNLTNNLRKIGANNDIKNILEAVATQSGVPFKQVIIRGSFPMVDVLGDESNAVVMTVRWNKATLDRINWKNKLTIDVEAAADLYYLHPAFNK